MESYRKKPVVIQAEHLTYEFLNDKFSELSNYVLNIIQEFGDKRVYYKRNCVRNFNGSCILNDEEPYSVEVETLEGKMKGNIGDYLIIGVEGEPYICREDIFEKTYEKVD